MAPSRRPVMQTLGPGLKGADEAVRRAVSQLEATGQDLHVRVAAVESGHTRLGHQVFTARGQYIPTQGTRMVRIRMVGGGGGGGGAAGGAGCAAGGGGASGVFLEVLVAGSTYLTGGTILVGAGGTAGVGTGGTGGNGGSSSVVVNGTTYTATGGGGGTGMTNGSALAVTQQPTGPVGGWYSGSNLVTYAFGTGLSGLRLSSSVATAGSGGGNPLGGPSVGTAANIAGVAPYGYGGGGTGSVATTTNTAGAPGAGGLVIIEEYQ